MTSGMRHLSRAGGHWRVAMLDPAGFTPAYDAALTGGLRSLGCRVVSIGPAFGRPLSNSEPHIGWFYRADPSIGSLPIAARYRRTFKGIHHILDMARLSRGCLDRLAPDIVHCQWLPLPFIDRLFLSGVRRRAPLVLTVHDSMPYNGAAGEVMATGMGATVRLCDAAIVHTTQAERHVERLGLPSSRIHRLAHGLLHIPNGTGHPEAQVPGGRIRLLLFGKLRPYKGVDVLLRSLAMLSPAERARLTVDIVGKPYMPTETLVEYVRTTGLQDVVRFRFDFVDDEEIGRLFAAADAALFPYRRIDASGAAMTAVAHGIPVLASAVGGFAEIFSDGRDARLVPPGDPVAIAGVLREWTEDPATLQRLRVGMVDMRATVPTWQQIARQTLEVYAAAYLCWSGRNSLPGAARVIAKPARSGLLADPD